MLDLGDQEFCDTFGCYTEESETAPWVAAIVGGLTGLTAAVLISHRPSRLNSDLELTAPPSGGLNP